MRIYGDYGRIPLLPAFQNIYQKKKEKNSVEGNFFSLQVGGLAHFIISMCNAGWKGRPTDTSKKNNNIRSLLK